MNHLLIQKHGYEPNVYNSTSSAGNIIALQLVMEALKLQPANPSFIQARDAILAADTSLFGGANHFEIWTAFARRGLGSGALTANSSSAFLTTSFTVPPNLGTLQVSTTSPAVNSITTVAPTTFVVNFTVAYLASSVEASDFRVNNIPATGFVLNDADTISFTYTTSPATTQGLQTMSILANTILKASDSSENLAFSGTFRWDATTLQVTATVPPTPNGVFTLPSPFAYDIDFNEPIAGGSVNLDDLTLSMGTVTAAVALDENTARYTLSGITTEGSLNVSLAAGKVTDAFGNPLLSTFTTNYAVDVGTAPFPTALAAKLPLGSLVYDASTPGSTRPLATLIGSL